MIALGFMKRLWRYVYDDLTILGKIFFFPSAAVMYLLLILMAVLEFPLLDIGYIITARLENKRNTIESIVYYLTSV